MTPSDPVIASLTIRLLGPIEVWVRGEPLPRLRSRTGQWLLALLALRAGSPVDRSWLAGTLWPESPQPQSLTSLRVTLADLRRALGPVAARLRSPTPQTLALDLTDAEVDVVAFDQAIAAGDPASLEQAVALYRGPLLEGCTEEWVLQERERREQTFLQALETLAARAREQGDAAGAERYLRQAVGVDPVRESVRRALMERLAESGNYAAAVEVYRELRERLHQELNAEPDPETTALFQQLRSQARERASAPRPPSPVPSLGAEPRPLRPLLPEGTVTFLFTDIEGSTRLWEQHAERMREALARHDTLLRQAIESHGGSVFKTFGDQFCAAFATAPDALVAAIAAQRSLSGLLIDDCRLMIDDGFPSPNQQSAIGNHQFLKVRMALHTGVAQEREGDYFGPTLNRVARLLSAGHGGQILLSAAAQELLRDHLPEGASLKELGTHRLKDLIRPEQVFQLVSPDLPADFPALVSLDARPNNLPIQPTPLLGRERELEVLHERLQRAGAPTEGGSRLVTLTGPGGTGKTRLGLQVAADLLEAFSDGVYFVDLAPIRDPGLVAAAIAQVLGVRESSNQPVLASLKDYLREKQLLLLLDNFEQVIEAAPIVSELLASSGGLRVVVTSREVLRLRGEEEFSVPPLSLPDRKERLPEVEALTQYGAVALFIQRAQAVKPEFAITNETAPAVAEICHRLDGLPLAIELAAARLKLLTPEGLLSRLENRLKLLVGGARDLPARQQTLRNTIAWSYELLEEAEKRLFGRLAVCVGGFTLEAAEAVVDGESDLEIDVLEGVGSLVQQSLLREAEGSEGNPRFRMLETVREFAWECLQASGEVEETRRRHAEFFRALAEGTEPKLHGPEQLIWLDRLEQDHDNLRAALAWSQEGACPDAVDRSRLGLCLAGALPWFWRLRCHLTEGHQWLQQVLAQTESLGRTPARAQAMVGAAELAASCNESEEARRLGEESAAIWTELRDRRGLASSMHCRILAARAMGEHETAYALAQESVTLWRGIDGGWGLAMALWMLGVCEAHRGNRDRARGLLQESMALFRKVGDPWGVGGPLGWLGLIARGQGELKAARAFFEAAEASARTVGDKWRVAGFVGALAKIALTEGDCDRASALHRESLAHSWESGHRDAIVVCLADLAGLAEKQGQLERATRLFGAVAALREVSGIPIPVALDDLERHRAVLRAALGDEPFAAAWAAGSTLSFDQAVAEALER